MILRKDQREQSGLEVHIDVSEDGENGAPLNITNRRFCNATWQVFC